MATTCRGQDQEGMDPGVAGSVGAALWCLRRLNQLERERIGSRRGLAAHLRSLAMAWAAAGVILSGAGACLLTGAAFAAAARLGATAAALYTATCAGLLILLLAVELLAFATRCRTAREAARRERRISARTLMRTGPQSESPV
jgi:hypothetical protein